MKRSESNSEYTYQARFMDFLFSLICALYLSFNFDNGSSLELSDGSRWKIHPDDIDQTSIWLTPMEIEIEPVNDKSYPYILYNLDTKQRVKASKIGSGNS
jgi:hypothetical protein